MPIGRFRSSLFGNLENFRVAEFSELAALTQRRVLKKRAAGCTKVNKILNNSKIIEAVFWAHKSSFYRADHLLIGFMHCDLVTAHRL